ncbi:enoyl-CoA hydratase-related protein [Candidatus Uabimicrobium amorphum]|uniref:Gamma-carboxygeranoyl-CoA hydratase n=1 Tax=Uabimicrobium amorphum TaxID=2596890 RepID=A0A5S9IRW9_UABAM|nr:enoyl-CoA hydratase-related protein [Candidatus Uabimicrobium amorphum]BBM87013.1 gamma-carboxygeranoyl-CoA hydratase [Candidatus Uabimicrobium amorphum]
MDYQNIQLTMEDSIAYLMLNRPNVCNAFNAQLISEVRGAIQKIKNSHIRVLVICAAGKHFCAGGDLQWMKDAQHADYQKNYDDMYEISCMFDDIYSIEIPTIAKVQGAAIGGGVGFVAACDIAICSTEAVFSLSEAKAGLVPACTTAYLLHKIPPTYLRRYFITGEKINAQTAHAIGLVSEVCEFENLTGQIALLCDHILQCGPNATQMAKALLRDVPNMSYAEFLVHGAKTVAKMRMSDEGREGFQAFLEKRKPHWRIEN